MTSVPSDTERFYDAVADEFEADYYGPRADPYLRFDVMAFEDVLEEAIASGAINTAVEIGSGSGHWLRWLETRGIRAVGVDASHRMCDIARASGLTAVQGDAAALPVPPESCDLVLCPYCALDHCSEYRTAFTEIARISRPGALAVLMVDNQNRFVRRYWHVNHTRVKSLGSDPRADGRWLHEVDGSRVSVYTKMFTPREIRELLPGWQVEAHGLGMLTPLVPWRLRRSLPGWVHRGALAGIGPIERRLCARFPDRAALSVYVARRLS
jgi:SAM-dependent methyltransferase